MTFTTWLLEQAGRNDPVGDLSGDALRTPGHPAENDGIGAWRDYLSLKTADPVVLATLEKAWQEYRSTVK
jgi:uncharacterized protein YozE (UPF0346 family)